MKTARAPRSILLATQSVADGGMETHVIDLAGEFARRGSRVTVLIPEDASLDRVAARAEAAGAGVLRLDTDGRNGRKAQIRRVLPLIRALRRAKPTVVHLHTGGATGGLAVIAAARLFTRAIVALTEHDVPYEQTTRGHRLTRSLLDRSLHLLVAVSRRNARLRRERLGVHARAFASILNGVPIPELAHGEQSLNRARVREELGIGPDRTVVGSLVRLAPGKGLDTLLEAFALVRAEQPCTLLLVGDGPLRGELALKARTLGIGDDVIFAGNQPKPMPYLDAMDVFALAVPAGSMSIALLEAMARELPPVITFGGPEEAVVDGKTGLTPPPNDPAALAQALGALVCDETERERLGETARAYVARHFSVRRVTDDLVTAYLGARRGELPERLRADAEPCAPAVEEPPGQ